MVTKLYLIACLIIIYASFSVKYGKENVTTKKSFYILERIVLQLSLIRPEVFVRRPFLRLALSEEENWESVLLLLQHDASVGIEAGDDDASFAAVLQQRLISSLK